MKKSCVDCELFKTLNVMKFTPQDTDGPRCNGKLRLKTSIRGYTMRVRAEILQQVKCSVVSLVRGAK